jgi:hypothetical protein
MRVNLNLGSDWGRPSAAPPKVSDKTTPAPPNHTESSATIKSSDGEPLLSGRMRSVVPDSEHPVDQNPTKAKTPQKIPLGIIF